ncbi:MAG: PAS domain S-box protein [Myxococcales bacterium]|nr:PAS domain S-box protein [Myxococcales bacterium]
MTSSKQPNLETKLFALLFRECTDAVFVVNKSTRTVISANPRLAEITGHTLSSLCDLPLDALVAVGSGRAALAEEILDGEGLHEEIALRRADDYLVYADLSVSHLEDAELGSFVACIARDTGERRLLERELIAKHAALHGAHRELEESARELAERNEELATRNHELALLGAQLSSTSRRALVGELSAGVAHSLNNPLAAVESTTRRLGKLIETDGTLELQCAARRYLDRIQDAISRIGEIVRALRNTHRGITHAQPARVLDLRDEVRIALTLFEARLHRVELKIGIDDDARAFAPPTDLQHVLWNLIDNALLAMPEGGVLSFEHRVAGDRVMLAVADTGPGIPDARRAMLFQPFNSTRAEGTGLGLCTAQRLARSWGGDVCLATTAGGACFELELPSEAPR